MGQNRTVPTLDRGIILSQSIVDLLKELIFDGRAKPGDRLNESSLSRELGVSRSPIREALHQLEEQGLVTIIPRRGTFVVCLSDEEIQKINSLRVILEAEALRLARAHLTSRSKEQLAEMVGKIETMGSVPSPEGARMDFEFHRAIWSLSENEFLERTLTTLTAPLFAFGTLRMLRAKEKEYVLTSHRPLFDFVCGSSKLSAEETILAHLRESYLNPERFSSYRGEQSG